LSGGERFSQGKRDLTWTQKKPGEERTIVIEEKKTELLLSRKKGREAARCSRRGREDQRELESRGERQILTDVLRPNYRREKRNKEKKPAQDKKKKK